MRNPITGTMRTPIFKIIDQAAAPIAVLVLVLLIIVGVVVGQRRDRVTSKPTAAESRALLTRTRDTLASLRRQAADSAFPLDEALQAFKEKYQPPPAPVIVAVPSTAPPAQARADLRRSPPPEPLPEPVLRVHGLVSNKDLSLVCVNNRILGVGGLVEGYKVVKIEPHQVTFDNQNGRLRIIRIK